jgi:hypothetical protein
LIELVFVRGVALLRLADDAGEFFDRVNIRQRRTRLNESLIVALAPAT